MSSSMYLTAPKILHPRASAHFERNGDSGVGRAALQFDAFELVHCIDLPIGSAVRYPVRHHEVFEWRSEEHTSELQSLMRISYAVFCLKKKNTTNKHWSQKTTSNSNITD